MATEKIVYRGQADEVETADGGHTFPRGEAVEVPAALAESLLEQDTFTRAPAPKKTDQEKK